MKSILIFVVSILGLFISQTNAMPPLEDTSKPTIAVFYADWCGSCKVLDPLLDEAINRAGGVDVFKVVTFDLTNEKTIADSSALAGQHSLTDLYNAHAPKTGFAYLVDYKGGNHVIVTKKDSVDNIVEKLEALKAQLK